MFRLFYIEKDIQRLLNEIKEKQDEVASVEKNKEQADEALKEKKKQAGKQSRELAELEQKIRVVVSFRIFFFDFLHLQKFWRNTQFLLTQFLGVRNE